MAKPSYHRVRILMHSFLRALIKNAHAYASYCGRKTITHTDMVDALSNMSRHFLGASAL